MIFPPMSCLALWSWLEPLSSWLERLGGVGLVLLGLADNSPIPLPGSMDAAVVFLSAHQRRLWWYYALMAIIGSLIGAYMAYAVGIESGKEALEKKIPRHKAEQIYERFDRKGFWTLFVPALLPPPVPYTPFLIAAGVLEYPRTKFLLAVGVARTIRYGALAFLGSIYGGQIFGFFQEYYKPFLWTLFGVAIVGGVAAVIWARKRKRAAKPVADVKDKEPKAA